MTPAKYDFTVWRGTSGPTQGIKVRLKATASDGSLVNVTYEDVRISIYKRSTLILLATLSGGEIVETNAGEAEINWQPTVHDTRLIPLGAKATYELEVWNAGTEIVYLYGTITGAGGLNDDEDAAS